MESDSVTRRRTRRRGSADDPLTKVTFQIHDSVMEQVRAAVEGGAAPSINAFMERAADLLLRELRRLEVYEAYGVAALDPAYMEGQAKLRADFEVAVADGLREVDGAAPPPPPEKAIGRRRASSGSRGQGRKDR